MPKSKIRRKTSYTSPRTAAAVRAAGPSHPVYVGVIIGMLLLGLAWAAVHYIAGDKVPFMRELGNWNFLISFAIGVTGLLMTLRWR